MCPEQARGEPATALSDIHACGVVLFIMLTGRRPVEADSVQDMLLKVAKDAVPSLHSLNPEVSVSLDEVVQKMMAKKPSERYPDAGAAIQAIDEALKDPGRRESSREGPDWRIWAAIAGGAAILILVLWLLLT